MLTKLNRGDPEKRKAAAGIQKKRLEVIKHRIRKLCNFCGSKVETTCLPLQDTALLFVAFHFVCCSQ